MHNSFNGYFKKRKISYSKSGCGCKQKCAEHKAKAAGFACPITCKVIAAFPYALFYPPAKKQFAFYLEKAKAFPSESDASTIFVVAY